MTERLQKYLARTGAGSRRQIEQWIREGRIIVDGKPVTLGAKVSKGSRIVVDGKKISSGSSSNIPLQVILHHKLAGEICSRDDPKGRPTVFDRLPRLRNGRWVGVGRLDLNTTGLMLFVTDGELANRLMHPSRQIEREYSCRIRGEVSARQIRKLSEGVILDGQLCRFETIRVRGGRSTNRWYDVVVREGKYREVRRLWAAVDCTVSRLIRIRYGPVQLPRSLRRGASMDLDIEGVQELCDLVGISSLTPRKQTTRSNRKKMGSRRR